MQRRCSEKYAGCTGDDPQTSPKKSKPYAEHIPQFPRTPIEPPALASHFVLPPHENCFPFERMVIVG
jgi:hypothetical protein